MGQVCIRLKAVSAGVAGGLVRHDINRPSYADPARSDNNKIWSWDPEGEVHNQPANLKSWGKWWKAKALNRCLAQATKYYLSGIITLSDAPGNPQDARIAALKTIRDITTKLRVRIVQISEHNDEKNQHWHVLLTNLGPDGRTVGRRLHRNDLSQIQDIAAAQFAGLGYERGAKGSRRKHYSVAEGHRRETLQAEAAHEIAVACEARAAKARAEAEAMERKARLAERKIRRDERYASGQRQRRRRVQQQRQQEAMR